MKSIGKWVVRAALAIVAIAVIAWLGLLAASEAILHKHYPFPANPPEINASGADVAAGAKLAHQFGCTGCHGDGLRGGLFPEIVPDEGAIGYRAPAAE